MLRAMFKEIQNLLNEKDGEYGLFNEFDPKIFQTKEILEKYKNIGVLYVNNGNLGKLPGGAMMEINYTLELFMRIEDSVNVADVIVSPLEALATGTTGQVQPNNGGGGNYFLNTGLPTSDGAIVEGADDHNYIRYELPISVIFTDGITIADNKDIVITIDGKEYPLKSVLSVVEVPQTQLETASFTNAKYDENGVLTHPAMQNESTVIGSGWSIQISKLYRSKEDEDIRDCILNTPNKVVTITYKGQPHKVVLHDCTFASELGQAEVMTINASTAMRGV